MNYLYYLFKQSIFYLHVSSTSSVVLTSCQEVFGLMIVPCACLNFLNPVQTYEISLSTLAQFQALGLEI